MKNYRLTLLVILTSLLLSGCFITNTPGFYSGYKKLSEQEKNTIKFTQNEQYSFDDTTKIYAITGTQLSEMLKKKTVQLFIFFRQIVRLKTVFLSNMLINYARQKIISLL